MRLSCVETPAPDSLVPALPVEAQDPIPMTFPLGPFWRDSECLQFILVESRVKGTKRTPLAVQMGKPRLTLLIHSTLSYGTTAPLVNPYICTHHSVLSESLMAKAIFHKRL